MTHVEKEWAAAVILPRGQPRSRSLRSESVERSKALSPHHLWVIEFVHWHESRTFPRKCCGCKSRAGASEDWAREARSPWRKNTPLAIGRYRRARPTGLTARTLTRPIKP